ncbi:hypothetical protein C1752_03394 [Acaryochloris thomasi RCC1774]|uniref:Uncharacterized protein n=2 Tax=Acaryochloris TaxID=155977 RepID=A0A2W1JG51_9CYAN|nr:hypothetical protein C1752_03394 [Acaryochloris thomasi RCC1774]
MVLLGFAGCVAGVGYFGQRVYTEIQKPVNEDDIVAALGDIPVYQPSKFDPELTKVLRSSTAILPDRLVATHAAFRSPDPEDTVIDWYKTEMSELGYESSDTELGFIRQVQFENGRDSLLVQLQPDSEGAEGSSRISLSLFQPLQSQEK